MSAFLAGTVQGRDESAARRKAHQRREIRGLAVIDLEEPVRKEGAVSLVREMLPALRMPVFVFLVG